MASLPCAAQSLDDLNIQLHGYATQGFLYTTNNNIFTTESSDGSPAWTEAVVNLSALPTPKLRVAVQARYELLGDLGNTVTLDYAAVDYKVNDKFGIRFGKTKIPSGLFNEIQDIDPSYLWALLPQAVYPITNRNSYLSQYGGVAYGTLSLSKALGKVDYRGWSGERTLSGNDGALLNLTEGGTVFPNGLSGIASGGAIHWRTPVAGLMVGASDVKFNRWVNPANVAGGTIIGTEEVNAYNEPHYFAKYEKAKVLLAYEYDRSVIGGHLTFPHFTVPYGPSDGRAEYAMATYKVTDKLSAGAYWSYGYTQHKQNYGTNFQKDYTISGRYDFSQYFYAKAEQHFINGEEFGYDLTLNPDGLKPNSKLTVLKVGVSF